MYDTYSVIEFCCQLSYTTFQKKELYNLEKISRSNELSGEQISLCTRGDAKPALPRELCCLTCRKHTLVLALRTVTPLLPHQRVALSDE